jgi:hypothetical protein
MGAALNENVDWGSVPISVRKTFRGKKARRILLKANTTLFTLSKRANLYRDADSGVPVLWSPYKPLKDDPGYQARAELANSSGSRSRRDIFRGNSASPIKKAGVRYAVAVKLLVPVWGFIGEIESVGLGLGLGASASRSAGLLSSGMMMGGGSRGGARSQKASDTFLQIYIPGLEPHLSVKRIKAHDLIVA